MAIGAQRLCVSLSVSDRDRYRFYLWGCSASPPPIRMATGMSVGLAIGISIGMAIRISIGMAIGAQRVCVRLSSSYKDGYREFYIGIAIGTQRVCVSLPSSYRDAVRDLYRDVYRDGYRGAACLCQPPFPPSGWL